MLLPPAAEPKTKGAAGAGLLAPGLAAPIKAFVLPVPPDVLPLSLAGMEKEKPPLAGPEVLVAVEGAVPAPMLAPDGAPNANDGCVPPDPKPLAKPPIGCDVAPPEPPKVKAAGEPCLLLSAVVLDEPKPPVEGALPKGFDLVLEAGGCANMPPLPLVPLAAPNVNEGVLLIAGALGLAGKAEDPKEKPPCVLWPGADEAVLPNEKAGFDSVAGEAKDTGAEDPFGADDGEVSIISDLPLPPKLVLPPAGVPKEKAGFDGSPVLVPAVFAGVPNSKAGLDGVAASSPALAPPKLLLPNAKDVDEGKPFDFFAVGSSCSSAALFLLASPENVLKESAGVAEAGGPKEKGEGVEGDTALLAPSAGLKAGTPKPPTGGGLASFAADGSRVALLAPKSGKATLFLLLSSPLVSPNPSEKEGALVETDLSAGAGVNVDARVESVVLAGEPKLKGDGLGLDTPLSAPAPSEKSGLLADAVSVPWLELAFASEEAKKLGTGPSFLEAGGVDDGLSVAARLAGLDESELEVALGAWKKLEPSVVLGTLKESESWALLVLVLEVDWKLNSGLLAGTAGSLAFGDTEKENGELEGFAAGASEAKPPRRPRSELPATPSLVEPLPASFWEEATSSDGERTSFSTGAAALPRSSLEGVAESL